VVPQSFSWHIPWFLHTEASPQLSPVSAKSPVLAKRRLVVLTKTTGVD
jgi:hypothetical protein